MKKYFIGMAIGAFVTGFIMVTNLVQVNAGQQLILGILLLIIARFAKEEA